MTTTQKTFISFTLLTIVIASVLFFVLPHIVSAASNSSFSPDSSILFVKPATINTGTAKFVSLTKMPLFSKGTSNGNMSAFLNTLYQYAIGVAVILAVLEVVWGGFLFMGSGASVTSKEAGKNKIGLALMGLLLVLSPYLIFQVINPQATSLKLGTEITLNKPPVYTLSESVSSCTSSCTISGNVFKSGTCNFTDSCTRYAASTWLKTHLPTSKLCPKTIFSIRNGANTLTATCVSTGGPFYMADVSSWYNWSSKYEPIGPTSSNAVDFVNTCIKNAGEYCYSVIPKTTCPAGTPEKFNGKCVSLTLTCEKYIKGYGHLNEQCSRSPLKQVN